MDEDRCRSLLKCNNDNSRKGGGEREEEEIRRSMAEEGGGLEFHHVAGIRLIISKWISPIFEIVHSSYASTIA